MEIYYHLVVTPRANDLMVEQRLRAAQGGANAKLGERSIYMVIKDREPQWEIVFCMWGMIVLTYKLGHITRERSLFKNDFIRLQPGERIIPEDALDRYKELKTAIERNPHWRERLLPECLLAALHRFHAYDSHRFKNSAWRPQTVLENHFPISQAYSHYSANFDIEDYESSDVEVVLETLFDDGRLHLTEKSLRPIAVGQPFILAGTQGSLEYLRSYGFKTFGDVWDESYDLVEDPAERLIQIAELMKYISTWLPHQRERNMAQAQAIADYNRQHFFSQEFFNQVTDELKTNLTSAFDQLDHPENYKINYWNQLASIPAMIEFVSANEETHQPTKSDLDLILNFLKNKTQ